MLRLREAKLRHTMHYLTLVKDGRNDQQRIGSEEGNINAALSYCIAESAFNSSALDLLAEFSKALNTYWLAQNPADFKKYNSILVERYYTDGYEKIALLDQLADLEEQMGDYQAAIRLRGQLAQVPYQEDDLTITWAYAENLRKLTGLISFQEDYVQLQKYSENWLSLAHKLNSIKGQADALLHLTVTYSRNGNYKKSEECCQKALDTARSVNYASGEISALTLSAEISQQKRDLKDSLTTYHMAAKLARDMGNPAKHREIFKRISELEELMKKRLFISYNNQDRGFVEKLATDLKNVGIAVWWDQWEIKPGDSITLKISEGIKQSAYLAVALSPSSVESPWVQRELGSALMNQLSAERGITVLPIMVRECEVPVLLRDIKWIDFRANYQDGVSALIEVLT